MTSETVSAETMTAEAVTAQLPAERRPPSWRRVGRAQLALVVAYRRRRRAVQVALAFGLLAVAAASDRFPAFIDLGTGEETRAEFHWAGPELLGMPEGMVALTFAFFALLLGSVIWPLRIWRDAGPSRRAYHWAMPVDRRVHDLLRVAAGAVWLTVVILAVLALGISLGLLFGRGSGLAQVSAWGWANFLVAPLIFYLLSSVAALASDRPAAWVFGLPLGWNALWWLARMLELGLVERSLGAIVNGPWSYGKMAGGAFIEGVLATGEIDGVAWVGAASLWLGVALAGLLAVVLHHPRDG